MLRHEPVVAAIDHVLLNLTKRCNQACVFCFEGDRSGWGEPSFEEVQALLRDAAQSFRLGVLMGGEALLRRDIADIVRYAGTLGMELAVFTNGRALARAELLAEVVQAGLRTFCISCHYGDAPSFAAGTRLPPERFGEFVQGLDNLAAYAHEHPDAGLAVHCETLLFRFNAGRLAAIRDILATHLGPLFGELALKAVQPTEARTDERLLEDLRARREELAAFCASWDPSRKLILIDVPLCLAPGYEHHSVFARYLLDDVAIACNFVDKRELDAAMQPVEVFRTNPYAWVCASCTLLPLCPTARTSWAYPSYRPDRDQKPVPERTRRTADVVAQLRGAPVDPATATRLDEMAARFAAVDLPETALVGAFGALDVAPFALADVWSGPLPVVSAEVRVGEGAHVVSIGFPTPGEDAGYLVGAYRVTVTDAESLPAAQRQALLQRLAPLTAVDPARFAEAGRIPGLDVSSLAPFAALSRTFGARLWPGLGVFEGWRVVAATAVRGGMRLRLAAPDGRVAELALLGAPMQTEEPPGPGLAPVWVGESASAHLLLVEDPVGDVLANHRSLEAIARAVSALVRRADAALDPRRGAADAHLGREGSLRVRFRDRGGKQDYVFFVARGGAGQAAFQRVGDVALAHLPCPQGVAFQVAAGILAEVARRLRLPPDTATAGDWERTTRLLFGRTALGRRFDVLVDFVE